MRIVSGACSIWTLLAFLLACYQPWIVHSEDTFPAGPSQSHAVQMFDLAGDSFLQDEDHLGIVNGKACLGINYRDVITLDGLWAPPFLSSNFLLDGRVAGEKVRTSRLKWRPFQVERLGTNGQCAVSSVTTLIYGQRTDSL